MSDFIRDLRSQVRQDANAELNSTAAGSEPQKPKFEDTPAGKAVGFVMMGLIGWFVYAVMNPDPEQVAKREAEKAQERQSGVHCRSPWDGSHDRVTEITKQNLRDPASFEHIRTRIGQNDNGVHSIKMEFRARNLFGGMSLGVTLGSIRNSDCGVIEAAIARFK